MSRTWRLLFDTVQFSLVSRTARSQPSVASDELEQTASYGLREVAGVLIESELRRDPDVELMWRYWADLSPERLGDDASRLNDIHGHLTLVVLAYLAHVASRDVDTSTDEAQVSSLLRRVSVMAVHPRLSELLRGLMDSAEEGRDAGDLWDQLARRDMPERQVVFVPSLRSAIARLLVLCVALRGRIRTPVGEWIATVDDAEVHNYLEDARAIARKSRRPLADGRGNGLDQR